MAPDSPLRTCVFWVADGKRAAGNLLLKEILLVQKEDDGGLCEPLVVADGVKQLHAFMHSILKRSTIGHALWSLPRCSNTSELPLGVNVV